MDNIQTWFLGFALGMLLLLVVYKIVYYIALYIFKLHGKQHNLKVNKCKRCKGYFYSYRIESVKFCSNCIYLKFDSIDK